MRTELSKQNLARSLAIAMLLCSGAQGASKYKVLHSFTGGADGDGGNALALNSKGNVYGASVGGGSQNCGPGGCGLIYELTPHSDGKYAFAVLYDFTGGTDAGGPISPLLLDASGNLHGTTTAGGARGGGTVFELTPGADGWTLITLYSFCNQQGCIGLPSSGVVMDPAGSLYTTSGEIDAAFGISLVSGHWKETTLHRFCAKGPPCPGGIDPFAGLILDSSGNLYGTTSYGGGEGCVEEGGCGTVYELTPEAGGKWKETILHRFDNSGKDGSTPGNGALSIDSAGNLYGTTEVGGGAGGWGTVFRLTPGPGGHWKEALLYSFSNGASGGFPAAGVVMDEAGNLYGTTVSGGDPDCDCGVVYRLAPTRKGKWRYTVLHTFRGPEGALPVGNLAIDVKGNLYGGTVGGGAYDNGVVFELTP